MEVKELYTFTLLLVLVGMIIGVGVLTLDKFGTASYNDRTVYNDTLTLWTNNFTAVTYPTATSTDAVVIVNSSGTAVSVAWDDTGKWSGTAVKLTTTTSNGTSINLTYTYGQDSVTTTALENSRIEIANVSSNWLGLIVTVAILAIILTLVIRSFARGRE